MKRILIEWERWKPFQVEGGAQTKGDSTGSREGRVPGAERTVGGGAAERQ